MKTAISKETICKNAVKHGIRTMQQLRKLLDNILGILSYNETNEEYDFLVSTAFGNTQEQDLPNGYLVIAASRIKEALEA